jgi:predicted O-methyltransferase YrrM
VTSGTAIADVRAAVESMMTSPPEPELRELLDGADIWAVHLDTAHVLNCALLALQPKSVLEFGAGRSSLVLASAMERYGGGRLTSIEHQPEYAAAAWRQMGRYANVDARLCPARLARRLSKFGMLYEYVGIRRMLDERGPFDFVFVDAPPGTADQPFGRDATLLQCAPWLADGAIAVLDDSARPAERTAVRRWQRVLGAEVICELKNARGNTVIRIPRGGPGTFSLRTFAGTLHDRFVSLGYRS